MDHPYIRHTVGGRLFLDSKKHGTPFAIAPAEGREGWTIAIDVPDAALAEGVIRHRDERTVRRTGRRGTSPRTAKSRTTPPPAGSSSKPTGASITTCDAVVAAGGRVPRVGIRPGDVRPLTRSPVTSKPRRTRSVPRPRARHAAS